MAARTGYEPTFGGFGVLDPKASPNQPGVLPGSKEICLGQSSSAVGSQTANQNMGTVALPHIAANTRGTVTVNNTLAVSASMIQITSWNNNADATASLAVPVALGAVVSGTSFVIEYMPTATMAQDWAAIYRIVG